MKRRSLTRTLAFITAFISAAPHALIAQTPGSDLLYTVGTSVEDTDNDGSTWVYLLWQSEAIDQLIGREYGIWSKAGTASAVGNYSYEGTVAVRLSVPAIQALLLRAQGLGDDLVALEGAVDALFEKFVPAGSISLAEKLSAVVAGALGDADSLENLVFLARRHVAVSLVIGTGYAVKVPTGQTRTWELRECVGGLDGADCDRVVGRLTVTAGSPTVLAAPGAPVYVPFQSNGVPDPRGHLVTPLRWMTPEALRLQSLLQFGYNLYRVDRDEGEANNWHINPPSVGELAFYHDIAEAEAASGTPLSTSVRRVNNAPILIERRLTEVEAVDLGADPETYFVVDDNRRDEPGGVTFVNGEQYYYFVTARDILGRDGETSDGALITICDRMPPPAPRGLKVTNHYTYDSATDTNRQYLQVRWTEPELGNRQTPETVGQYYVYRWHTLQEMRQRQGLPFVGATAVKGGLVAIVPAGTTKYIDDGVGAPCLQAVRNADGSITWSGTNAGETYWYTVRSEDLGACDRNLSGNSPPAYGVLRDRIGPPRPGGSIRINCVELRLTGNDSIQIEPWERLEDNTLYLELQTEKIDEGVEWVEYAVHDPQTGSYTPLSPRIYFAPGEKFAVYQHKMPATMESYHWIAARVGGLRNERTNWVAMSVIYSKGQEAWQMRWKAEVIRIQTPREGDCDTHVSRNPDMTIVGPEITITLTEGTEEYRLFRRVDNGRLTLVEQGLASAAEILQVIVQDLGMPAQDCTICYYVQVYDQHGNPSPMVRIGCVDIEGSHTLPAPMLSDLEAQGDAAAPDALMFWFCPPYGIERFELYIQSNGDPITAKLGADFEPDSDEDDGWQTFLTKRVPTTFGSESPEFGTLLSGLATGVEYTLKIRAIGPSGSVGDFSNEVRFRWNPPTDDTVAGPNVPWPALGLPEIAASFHAGIEAMMGDGKQWLGAQVRVGAFDLGNLDVQQTEKPGEFWYPATFAAGSEALYRNRADESLAPFMLYRYQVDVGSDLYATASGDVYQVSPLIEDIATALADLNGRKNLKNYDPYFLVEENVETREITTDYDLYLKDTQPLVRGCTYRYLLVRFDPVSKEILEVIPSNLLSVPN